MNYQVKCEKCGNAWWCITDYELRSLWAARNASRRTTYTGGKVWKKHNPNTTRCRCQRCTAKRAKHD